jgi:hypothetical protein
MRVDERDESRCREGKHELHHRRAEASERCMRLRREYQVRHLDSGIGGKEVAPCRQNSQNRTDTAIMTGTAKHQLLGHREGPKHGAGAED